MEIDWSWANPATAWEWDGSFAIASDEGAEKADTGAHAADELRVRGIWGSLRWLNTGLRGGTVILKAELFWADNLRTDGAEQCQHGVDVSELGEVPDTGAARDRKGGSKNWQ